MLYKPSTLKLISVAAAPPAAHEAQDSRWLQDSADSVAWAAHGMPESPHEISRPG
jgi:hypothetical protein